MARKKNELDTEEIDEIIELFITKEIDGNIVELNSKRISDFNKLIAQNDQYTRKNGSLFKLYKYNIWAGSYKGEDCYGKARIKQIKETNEVKIIGEEFNPDALDIVQIVNKYKDKPEMLTDQLTRLFIKERKKNNTLSRKIKELEKRIRDQDEKINVFDKAVTDIFYMSQYPDNSLNNMLNLKKEKDAFCYDELKKMFSSGGDRIAKLIDDNKEVYAKKENVIPIKDKTKQSKYKDL